MEVIDDSSMDTQTCARIKDALLIQVRIRVDTFKFRL